MKRKHQGQEETFDDWCTVWHKRIACCSEGFEKVLYEQRESAEVYSSGFVHSDDDNEPLERWSLAQKLAEFPPCPKYDPNYNTDWHDNPYVWDPNKI